MSTPLLILTGLVLSIVFLFCFSLVFLLNKIKRLEGQYQAVHKDFNVLQELTQGLGRSFLEQERYVRSLLREPMSTAGGSEDRGAVSSTTDVLQRLDEGESVEDIAIALELQQEEVALMKMIREKNQQVEHS